MLEKPIGAVDDRQGEISRDVWRMREETASEARGHARNVIIIAGALAAFSMPVFAAAEDLLTTLVVGVALLAFLIAILVGVLQTAYNLWSTNSALSDLLLWLHEGDERARARYDTKKAKCKILDRKRGSPLTFPIICLLLGVALLVGSVALAVFERVRNPMEDEKATTAAQAGSTVPAGARQRAPAVP